ncbi:MAG: hypothetical protein RI973_884 [Bacteroidota bacterium]|jgi:AraC-like DNA-binding protein
MKQIQAAALLILVLLGSVELPAQPASFELVEKAWELMSTDQAAADSITYLLLESVNDDPAVNDSLLANILFLAGTLEHYKKRYHISCSFIEQALRTDFIRDSKERSLKCLNNLGTSLNYLGKIPEALDALQKAMKLSVELNDQESIDDLRINIAELECELGEYDEAISLANQALESWEQKKDTFKMGLCQLNIGKYLIYKKEYEKAAQHNRKAIRFFEYLGDNYSLIAALVNQSMLEQLKKKYAVSEQILQRIISIVEIEKFEYNLAPLYIQKADNAIATGTDLPKAREYALEAIRLAEISGKRTYLEEATLALAKYYAKVQDFDNFESTIEKYNEVKRETATLSAKAAAEELKIVYDMEGLSSHNVQLQQDVRSKNRQLLLSLLLSLVSTGAGGIIYLQYRKLKRNMKTMFQMNLSLAYSKRDDGGKPARPIDEASPNLSDSDLYKLILKIIEQKELYKDPLLSLHDLATHLKRPKHVVSKAINNAGRTNFAGLMNEFKVNEARRLIIEKGNAIAVSDIASMAGFNSRSSFNRHFKELTGFTPTDYIEMMGRMKGPSEETEGEDLG